MLFQKPIKPRKTATSQKAAAPYEVVVMKADSNPKKLKPETLVCGVSICLIKNKKTGMNMHGA